ncbi:MAG: glycosyltransferase family 39 protein [Anaerolineae bacterium]
MKETRGRPWYDVIDGGWAIVTIPLLLGFALRLWYALQATPFVDEPTTVLVARSIAATGLPTLPSGLFYGNDLPFSYLAGGAVALAGSGAGAQLLAIRLLSVAAGTLTIGLVYLAGRRYLSARAGFFAALLLALSPEAVLWGGRARAYALLGLMVLGAVSLYYAGLPASGRPASQARGGLYRRLGLALLVVATFVHPEAALLLPALAVGAAVVEGWRWWLRPAHLAELVLAGLGVAGRYLLQLALARGWIGSFATVAGSRPPLALPADWLLRLESVRPFFFDPERLPWMLLALLALALALTSGGVIGARRRSAKVRSNGFSRILYGRAKATLFFSTCLWLVPLGMLLLLGSTYQSPRYLTMLLPLFALLAGDGLERTVGLLAGGAASIVDPLSGERTPAPRGSLEHGERLLAGRQILVAGLAAGLVALLLAGYLPPAVAAATTQEKGFQPAFEYVARHREAGDRVATVAPAACQLVLDDCDLFALGIDYEEFAYRDADGRLVDRWLGSPLIRTAAELEQALDQALAQGRRLWFVSDEVRFRQRFTAAFDQAVWLGMELVAKTAGVMVFRSVEASEPAAAGLLDAVFGDQVALVGYDLGRASDQGQAGQPGWGEVVARPGQSLPLILKWQAVAPPLGDYTAFVHLLAADGNRVAQDDGPPLRGLQPTSRWLPGETLPDRRALALPPDLAPGLYRIEVGLYSLADEGDRLPLSASHGALPGERLIVDYVRVLAGGEAPPAPDKARQVLLSGEGDQIQLLGYSLSAARAQAGGSLDLSLYWQALERPAVDYTVLLHLLDD